MCHLHAPVAAALACIVWERLLEKRYRDRLELERVSSTAMQCFARSAFAKVVVRRRRERVHDLFGLLGVEEGKQASKAKLSSATGTQGGDAAGEASGLSTAALGDSEVRALKKDIGYDLLDSNKDESLIKRMLTSLAMAIRSHCVAVDAASAYKAYKDATMLDPLCSTAQVSRPLSEMGFYLCSRVAAHFNAPPPSMELPS